MKKLILVLIFCFMPIMVSAAWNYDLWKQTGDVLGKDQQGIICAGFSDGFLFGQEFANKQIFNSRGDVLRDLVNEIYEVPKYRDLAVQAILAIIMLSKNRIELYSRLDRSIK